MNSPFPIMTKQLSKIFSNTERREVVFRTQWFIGQYCSERERRGYRSRCTSVILSLYFISILWLHSTDGRKGDGFFLFQTITAAQVRVFFLFLQRFSSFFSTFSIRPSIPSLFHCPTGHESRRFQCQSRIIIFFLRYWHWKNLFTIVSRLVQMTKCGATSHGMRCFFIGTLAIFMYEYIIGWILNK